MEIKPHTLWLFLIYLCVHITHGHTRSFLWSNFQSGTFNFSAPENWDQNLIPGERDFVTINVRDYALKIYMDLDETNLDGFAFGQVSAAQNTDVYIEKNFVSKTGVLLGNGNIMVLPGVTFDVEEMELGLASQDRGQMYFFAGSTLSSLLTSSSTWNVVLFQGNTTILKTIKLDAGRVDILAPLIFKVHPRTRAKASIRAAARTQVFITSNLSGDGTIESNGTVIISGKLQVGVDFSMYGKDEGLEVGSGSILKFQNIFYCETFISMPVGAAQIEFYAPAYFLVSGSGWFLRGEWKIYGIATFSSSIVLYVTDNFAMNVYNKIVFASFLGMNGPKCLLNLHRKAEAIFKIGATGSTFIAVPTNVTESKFVILADVRSVTLNIDSAIKFYRSEIEIQISTIMMVTDDFVCDPDTKFDVKGQLIFKPLNDDLAKCKCHACFKPRCSGISSDSSSVCNGRGSCQINQKCACPAEYRHQNATCCFDNGQCQCNNGFFGKDCEVIQCFGKFTNETGVCSNHGSCTGPNTCKCDERWTGPNCQYPTCFGSSETSQNPPCSQRGLCKAPDNCTCSQGYSGIQCEVVMCFGKSEMDSGVCNQRQGSCVSPNRCDCKNPSQWSGLQCEIPMCGRNETQSCHDRGQCVKPGECKCDLAYFGTNCECYLVFFGSLCKEKHYFSFIIFWVSLASGLLFLIINFCIDFGLILKSIRKKYHIVRKFYPSQSFKPETTELKEPLLGKQ